MLSYRHSYHAGNFADVIKHIVLIEVLKHLSKKDAPFDYFDTHAGTGLYYLGSAQASRLQEYTNGVGKLKAEAWPELSRYFTILNKYNPSGTLHRYPGSPLIALDFLRAKDRAWLFEMHPADFELLKKNVTNDKRVRVTREDGFKGLLPLLPPVSRRGLILIDPSYEIKSDYAQVFETVNLAWQKFSGGTYALWYPVVERKRISQFENKFKNSGIKNIQRFELGLADDTRGKGMTAAGMIVVNPPWKLMGKMSQLLPRLVETLGESPGAFYKSEVLVDE